MTVAVRKTSVRRTLRFGRLFVIVAVLIGTAAALFGLNQVQVRRHARAILERANQAVAADQIPAAAKLYKTYLNFNPRDAEALSQFAAALEGTPRPPVNELVSLYQRLREIESLSDDERLKLARHYVGMRSFTAGRDTLKESLASRPNDPVALDLLARCEEGEGQYPTAIENYRAALATGQAAPETYARLADVLRLQVKTPAAVAEADRILLGLVQERPTDLSARLARARYLARTNRPQDAIAEAEYAFRNIPEGQGDAGVALLLAALATTPETLPTAREALSKALERNPNHSDLRLAVANAEVRTGDIAAAVRTLNAAAANITEKNVTLFTIGDRLIDLGDPAGAETIAARLTGDPTSEYAAEYLRGRIALMQGEWPQARTLLASAAENLTRLPTFRAKALTDLAAAHNRAGDAEARLQALTSAVRIDPALVSARTAQSDALFRVGKLKEAIETLLPVAATSSAARAALCELRLAEQLARPEPERNWSLVDQTAGAGPQPPEVEVVRANARMAQGKPAEAVQLLREVVARPGAAALPAVWVALTLAQSAVDPAAAAATLDQATTQLGDHPDFRLTRAALLMRQSAPNAEAIAQLGDNLGAFNSADRARVALRLGQLVLALGEQKRALPLFRQAAADVPFDVGVRVAAFDLASSIPDPTAQAELLAEIRALDGPTGPATLLAEATQQVRTLDPTDQAAVTALRSKVESAREKRPGFGPVYVLLGLLDGLAGKPDAATDHFRRAIQLGEQSEPVVRAFVNLLLERQGHLEALELLARLERRGALAPDLFKQLTLLRASHGSEAQTGLAWAKRPHAAASTDFRDHLARAALFEAAGDLPDARKAAERAVALAGAQPEPWVAFVRLLVLTGSSRDARTAADEADKKLSRTPPGPAAAANALALGMIQELIGQPAAAEPLYRQALDFLPHAPAVVSQLARFLRSAGRPDEAQTVYQNLLSGAPPDVTRWARRNLALDLAAGSPTPAARQQALGLIDQNRAEGGELRDDERAKALILATDPFQLPAAIALLQESAAQSPLTPEQNYYLGLMYAQTGQLPLAESALREATRSSQTTAPEHLAALVRVALDRGNLATAREAANRLQTLAPASFTALAAKARLLAAGGQVDEAANLLMSSPLAQNEKLAGTRLASLLEEFGAIDPAETLLKRAAPPGPTGHAALAAFYLRIHRPVAAAELALAHEVAAPAGLTARIFAAALHDNPAAMVKEADLPAWTDLVEQIQSWVAARAAAAPGDPNLMIAQAELLDHTGAHAEALRKYEAGLRINPDDETILNNTAMLYALVEKDGGDRPQKLLAHLIERHGTKASYLDTRAVVHLAGGRLDEAATDLNAAIALKPAPAYYFHLAVVHDTRASQLGKSDEVLARNRAFDEAIRRGLVKSNLHQLEWPTYDRLRAVRR